MSSKESLQEIKDWVEYFTRLDYVEPIVRGEVQQKFKQAYWGTLDHFKKIEKDLKVLEELKRLINGLEYTFNRPGISSDTDILGTFMKDYFINNSKVVKEWLNNER